MSISKMNTMKVSELRTLAKERGLKGYSQLRKADLVHLSEESQAPVAPLSKEGKRRTVLKVSIILHPQDMDIFERQEMEKQRPLVKNKLNEWYEWLVHHVPKTVKGKVSDVFKVFKERIVGLLRKVRGGETLKDIVEEEAEKEHQEDQEEEQQKTI